MAIADLPPTSAGRAAPPIRISAGAELRPPIFLFGNYRSGTTITQKLIGLHVTEHVPKFRCAVAHDHQLTALYDLGEGGRHQASDVGNLALDVGTIGPVQVRQRHVPVVDPHLVPFADQSLD